ncbi:MAG TPA: hypothetical protein DEP84_05630 [Chloroflexi bacterium]|nr:hypothetical protein [Chloroflexota bacterium]
MAAHQRAARCRPLRAGGLAVRGPAARPGEPAGEQLDRDAGGRARHLPLARANRRAGRAGGRRAGSQRDLHLHLAAVAHTLLPITSPAPP